MLTPDHIQELHESLCSGNWCGFYVQGGYKYPQQQRTEFADGIVRGEGADGIGTFLIERQYCAAGTRELRIGWIKTYTNAHSILYLGVYNGFNIKGNWSIGGWGGDRFEFAPERPVSDALP